MTFAAWAQVMISIVVFKTRQVMIIGVPIQVIGVYKMYMCIAYGRAGVSLSKCNVVVDIKIPCE